MATVTVIVSDLTAGSRLSHHTTKRGYASCCLHVPGLVTLLSVWLACQFHLVRNPMCVLLLSHRRREDVKITAADLLNIRGMPGSITEAGVRGNLHVALAYMESWLR